MTTDNFEELADDLVYYLKNGDVEVFRDDNGSVILGHKGRYYRALPELIEYVRAAHDLEAL